MDCSICLTEIKPNEIGWSDGNNAQPVNDGRCCDSCNIKVVIPVRFRMLHEQD